MRNICKSSILDSLEFLNEPTTTKKEKNKHYICIWKHLVWQTFSHLYELWKHRLTFIFLPMQFQTWLKQIVETWKWSFFKWIKMKENAAIGKFLDISTKLVGKRFKTFVPNWCQIYCGHSHSHSNTVWNYENRFCPSVLK